ncbi:type II secretion system F family protein [Streptomonospora wellingtoniae]|uniref:Type II secretion system F family protein n=1 Tax=Streptomonospora wellingtoniae TaxID=3075544 RepID=A0ABU2KXL5_9ACTN|nr:type II secretion system F family protein [Streptomonospora sp. DSM 45055]MDT0304034.1 type II secretion system F family protein [Streptomonospora sp. DSM 45055]
MSTCTSVALSAPTHLSLLPALLPEPVPAVSQWLAERAGRLLLFGAAGLVAVHLTPATAVVRLRALRSREERRGGRRWGGTRALPIAQRLRARLRLAAGRVQSRRRRAAVELCRVLAAELRAGRDPGAAVTAAVSELDAETERELAPLTAAARSGQDPVPVLLALAEARGAEGLGQLAACWRVATNTGAGLADVVDRLSVSLTADEALRREVGAQLAGPRATAVMLSALPVLGLGMATALGGSPLAFLFSTPVGLACLAVGLLLDAAGLFWTHRMARRVLTETGMA